MAETASASIAVDQIDASHWQYTITLDDTGSTTIGTFWFAWVPGEDFLATSPTSVTSPTGWTDNITHAGPSDGYAIQWVAGSSAADVQSGGSLTGFSFVSTDSPSSVFGNSVFFPSTPVTTTFIYSAGPFSDAGFKFQVTSAALAPVVSGGETLPISTGQTSTGVAIENGGTVLVLSGGTASNTTVSSGGSLLVSLGGVADPTILLAGASEVVSAGGTDLGALISGGTQTDFGLASGATVNNGGLQFVLSGGSAIGTIVSSGGEQYVGAGGTSLAVQVKGGGAEVVFGTDSGANLSGTSAATATQYDFGVARGGTTFSNGFQQVALAGAIASGMTIAFGGEQYVGAGGTTLAAVVTSGGAEAVFGFDSGASLSGTQYDFGIASGGTTFNNGFQEVAPGATAIGMTVSSGGQQYVGSGGTAIATTIALQGAQVVFGSALGGTVSGTQYDFAYASGGTTFNSGFQEVASGAVAIGMTISSGGEEYVGAGGTASAADIATQGAEVVFGIDSGALDSGTQYVFGIASGGTTFNSASQQIEPGGTAIGMTVSSGGVQNVGGGGTAIGTQIMSQGAETVHGTDLGATIDGTQNVAGLASGTVVGTGGYQLVSAGGIISAATISGGTIELTSGASDGTAPITFAAAGDVLLDASTSFSGTVAGFGSASLNDSIDFADIPFVSSGSTGATTLSWTPTNGSSGTLTVSEGGHTAAVTLLGQYVQAYFGSSSDSHGGTLVTYQSPVESIDSSPQVVAASRHG